MRFRQLSKKCCAFAVKLQSNAPALLIKSGEGFSHALAEKVSPHFYQELLREFSFFAYLLLRFNAVACRHQVGAFSDLCNQPFIFGMDEAEFQFRYLCQLLPRGRNLLWIEPGNLHKNPVGTLWCNHRFAHAELIDALPNDLDCLIESIGGDRAFTFRAKTNQKGCAALQIKPKADGFVWRIEHR